MVSPGDANARTTQSSTSSDPLPVTTHSEPKPAILAIVRLRESPYMSG